jgi:hypothetical protein
MIKDFMSRCGWALGKWATLPGQTDARITLASAAALVLMALTTWGQALGQTNTTDGFEERWLAETASDLNRLLPRQADMETRLDAVTAGPGRRINFHYTLLDRTRASMDIESFNAGLQPLLRNSICRKDSARSSLMSGITLSYNYRGSDGKFVSMIEISPQTCR